MTKPSRNPVNGPQSAAQGAPQLSVGEPKGAARKGVLSALGSDPLTVTVTGIAPGLQIQCDGVPVADGLCVCGQHERARGRGAVARLTDRVIVGICPHTTAAEGRTAA
jgi:hypothetical protein